MSITPPEPFELSLEVAGKNFRFWSGAAEVIIVLDGHPQLTFSAPFDPDNADHRETFRPFSYKPVRALMGGVPKFSGVMVGVNPQVEADSSTVDVSCYSRAAVLEDVTAPADSPLEFNKLTLSQISAALLPPFGITASILAPATDGARFDRVKKKPDEKIQNFLAELAKQRGLVLSSDASGNLVFKKSSSGVGLPVAVLDDGAQPVLSVGVNFSPQNYFSEVTCLSKTKGTRKGGKYTEQNSFLAGSGIVRPIVIELDDTDPGDIQIATRAQIGRMFGNVCSYDVEVVDWFDQNGNLWDVDTRILLTAKRAMVYTQSEFLIRAVKFSQHEDKSRTATLNVVLPGAFSGELPESLPWEG